MDVTLRSIPDLQEYGPYTLVNYAPPNITGISHVDCTADSNDALFLSDCPRVGGGVLTISGTNFGTNAAVMIGSMMCGNVISYRSLY